MIAARLLQKIESNWETIAQTVINARHDDPELPSYRRLSDEEIRLRVRDLTTNLSAWLTARSEAAIISHYEELGRRRYQEQIPLSEVIQKLTILKGAIRKYASEHNYSLTAIEIYDELELLRAMAAFFDLVIFRVAKGYEEALHENDKREPGRFRLRQTA